MLQIIDNAKFMASAPSKHANKYYSGFHKIWWKYGHDDKKRKTCKI